MRYSTLHTIATVARREIQVAMKTKGIWITLAIMLILIIAAPIVFSLIGPDSEAEKPSVVATTAPEALTGTGYTALTVPDEAAATEAIRDGAATAGLVAAGDGWRILTDGSPTMTLELALTQAVTTYSQAEAFGALGLSPAEISTATAPPAIDTVDISASTDEANENLPFTVFVAVIGIFVTMMCVILFAANIGSRVTEEKTSRVVELILATIRPMDLLAGKIIGNALVATVLTLVLTLAAAVSLSIADLPIDAEFSYAILPILLVGFLISVTFFSALYAAAGAMVKRTEDLQSTQMPIMVLFFITIYVPMFGFQAIDSPFMAVMAWIPPVSAMTAPLMWAAGAMSILELIGSFVIAALATVAAIWLVGRIYRAAILNNGAKLSWATALRPRTA